MTTDTNTQEQWRLAFHEAGHAVANVLMEMPFSFVTVEGPQPCVNAVSPILGWERGDGSKRELVRKYAVCCYAGAAAEEHFIGCCAERYTDFDNASYWLSQYTRPRGAQVVGDEAFERQEERLRNQARALIRAHAGEVRVVSQALFERGTLTCEEVTTLMGGKAARRCSMAIERRNPGVHLRPYREQYKGGVR